MFQLPNEGKINNTPNLIRHQHEDSVSFVLEIDGGHSNQNFTNSPNFQNADNSNGIDLNLGKMSMKGCKDNPYLPTLNPNTTRRYSTEHADSFSTSFSSSDESSLGRPSSPDHSGIEDPNQTTDSGLMLGTINHNNSYSLSHYMSLSATADQLNVLTSTFESDSVVNLDTATSLGFGKG